MGMRMAALPGSGVMSGRFFRHASRATSLSGDLSREGAAALGSAGSGFASAVVAARSPSRGAAGFALAAGAARGGRGAAASAACSGGGTGGARPRPRRRRLPRHRCLRRPVARGRRRRRRGGGHWRRRRGRRGGGSSGSIGGSISNPRMKTEAAVRVAAARPAGRIEPPERCGVVRWRRLDGAWRGSASARLHAGHSKHNHGK